MMKMTTGMTIRRTRTTATEATTGTRMSLDEPEIYKQYIMNINKNMNI